MKLKKFILKAKDKILDAVFPDNISCIFCGRDVVEADICPTCNKQDILNKGNRCKFCDSKIKEGNIVCDHCKTKQPQFKSCHCPFVYNDYTRSSILKLKSDGAKYLAKYFVKHIYERLVTDKVEFDVIIPVPSHKKTIRKRGYNPAKILADELAILSCKPVENILIKTTLTKNQKLLNFEQRQNNLENSISVINPTIIKGKTVLIIDDIITTGSTINACAKVLSKAKEVYACAIARRNI